MQTASNRSNGNRARRSALALTLLAAAAAVPRLVPAQEPGAPTDELQRAILRYAFRFDGGNARLVPGRVPDDLAPNFYAPAGTRVLGTVISGSSAVVLASTTTPPESLRAEYTRVLGARGWRVAPARPGGGFVPSQSHVPLTFCRENAQLYIRHTLRATPPHDLHLEYRDGGGLCESVRAQRVEFVGMNRGPEFPTLYDPPSPPGVPPRRCFPTGPGHGALGPMTFVHSNVSAAEVLDHYGRQLEASGWKVPAGRAAAVTASGTWARTDSARTSHLTLEVTEQPPGTGCFQVHMKMSG